MLVLSLFPGAGLCEYGFTRKGDTVVRGPDKLWGQDIKDFKGMEGKFDLIIGGPPCQLFSRGNISGKGVNLIPEFMRVFEECKPRYAVMENVILAQKASPDWPYVDIIDSDIGGLTKRKRRFWFYGLPPAPKPVHDKEKYKAAAYSVLASSRSNRGKSWAIKYFSHYQPDEAAKLQGFPGLEKEIMEAATAVAIPKGVDKKTYPQRYPDEAAELQGFKELDEVIMSAFPRGMSKTSKEYLAVHLLGNGWTKAMSIYIADWIHYYNEKAS